ncbi:MAG: hypothetical protein BZY88_07220 [SAR202 cluster bacterium Io17-Chloro-G9]|nr:MAG: hypothetical protein BZY88_07220 [SAR202 cluster bacterium Io17-Chloro-G9]
MHHWEVGGTIHIGWPDYGIRETGYSIVECERMGQVFRARVTDGTKQGGFLVVFDCPDVVLEILAGQATEALGFKVIVSGLRCSIEGTVLHSLDYEWYPTEEYAGRPSLLSHTVADLLAAMSKDPQD